MPMYNETRNMALGLMAEPPEQVFGSVSNAVFAMQPLAPWQFFGKTFESPPRQQALCFGLQTQYEKQYERDRKKAKKTYDQILRRLQTLPGSDAGEIPALLMKAPLAEWFSPIFLAADEITAFLSQVEKLPEPLRMEIRGCAQMELERMAAFRDVLEELSKI